MILIICARILCKFSMAMFVYLPGRCIYVGVDNNSKFHHGCQDSKLKALIIIAWTCVSKNGVTNGHNVNTPRKRRWEPEKNGGAWNIIIFSDFQIKRWNQKKNTIIKTKMEDDVSFQRGVVQVLMLVFAEYDKRMETYWYRYLGISFKKTKIGVHFGIRFWGSSISNESCEWTMNCGGVVWNSEKIMAKIPRELGSRGYEKDCLKR